MTGDGDSESTVFLGVDMHEGKSLTTSKGQVGVVHATQSATLLPYFTAPLSPMCRRVAKRHEETV